MKVLVTGGGTGGHLYPALAVIDWLKANHPETECLYVGNDNRLEAQVVPPLGLPHEFLSVSGMPRSINPFQWGPWLTGQVKAYWRSIKLIQSFKPDIAFGTGGYVTVAPLLAAKSQGTPIVLHEPDAHPGLATMALIAQASAVSLAFEECKKAVFPRHHLHHTGNPLRSSVGQLSQAEGLQQLRLDWPTDKPILLVMGGSLGARSLNQALLGCLPTLLNELNIAVIHQTGQKLFDETLAALPAEAQSHPFYCVKPYFESMAPALAAASLSVCRAGSLSLSELYRSHLPSILVPYPHAAGNHQLKNALASQQAGASQLLEDHELTPETLLTLLKPLLSQPAQLQAMRLAAQRLATPNATEHVAALLLKHAR